ncbi:MAG: hypothetical protein ACJ76P_04405 [Actinomycetota bacterium]
MSGFDGLVAVATEEPSILGVILSGSRGRGSVGADSDWDCYVVVDEEALDDGMRSIREIDDPMLDCVVLGFGEFQRYAEPGSANFWEAYAFAHVTTSYDSLDGAIADLAAQKEFLDEGIADGIARTALDAFLNQCIRAAKDRRDGNDDAAVLDCAGAVSPALETVFALEGRVRPYNRYLSWEVERHPLELFRGDRFVDVVKRLASADPQAVAELFHLLERVARSAGIGDVIDAWSDRDLELLA